MRPLITQFDPEKSRRKNSVVVCNHGCCCCCTSCSCVVTTIGSSILLARRLGLSLANQKAQDQLKMEDKSFSDRVRSAKLFGFLIFPACLLATIFALFMFSALIFGQFVYVFPPILLALLYGYGLFRMHKKYGLPIRNMIQYFFLTLLVFVVEFFIWLLFFIKT